MLITVTCIFFSKTWKWLHVFLSVEHLTKKRKQAETTKYKLFSPLPRMKTLTIRSRGSRSSRLQFSERDVGRRSCPCGRSRGRGIDTAAPSRPSLGAQAGVDVTILRKRSQPLRCKARGKYIKKQSCLRSSLKYCTHHNATMKILRWHCSQTIYQNICSEKLTYICKATIFIFFSPDILSWHFSYCHWNYTLWHF